jgi:hypothetical protein
MDFSQLPPEPAERAVAIYQQLRQAGDARLRELAALLASRPDNRLLGQTEFEVRDLVHELGAEALEAAARRWGKGGTGGPA